MFSLVSSKLGLAYSNFAAVSPLLKKPLTIITEVVSGRSAPHLMLAAFADNL